MVIKTFAKKKKNSRMGRTASMAEMLRKSEIIPEVMGDRGQENLADGITASAYIDTRDYVAAESNNKHHNAEHVGMSEDGAVITRHRGTGPYGRVPHLANHQHQLLNNRREIVGGGAGTAGSRFFDYGDYSYGGAGHYGVNRAGLAAEGHYDDRYNHGQRSREELCPPEEQGVSNTTVLVVLVGTLMGFLNLYDKSIFGRSRRSLSSHGVLHLIMTGLTIIAFHFLPMHFLMITL